MEQWEIVNIINLVIALGIINVWIIRYDSETPFRGGDSKSLKEEFNTYGLPLWFMYFVGFAKISLAILLFLGIWIQNLSFFGSLIFSSLISNIEILSNSSPIDTSTIILFIKFYTMLSCYKYV